MNCPLQTHGLHELARQALARSSLAGGNQSSAVVTVKVESDQKAERKSKRAEREGSKAYWGNENPLPAARCRRPAYRMRCPFLGCLRSPAQIPEDRLGNSGACATLRSKELQTAIHVLQKNWVASFG